MTNSAAEVRKRDKAAPFDSNPAHKTTQAIKDVYEPSRYSVEFPCISITGTVFTIVLQIVDVVFDLLVAGDRYRTNPVHFILTLAFVFIPNYCLGGLLSIVQNKLYRRSRKNENDYLQVPRPIQVLRRVFYILCLNSATTEIEYLHYGLQRSHVKTDLAGHKRYTSAMAASKLQGSVVRVLEALMEAAPQLLLTLYIELSSGYDFNLDIYSWTCKSWRLVLSSAFSLLSVAWNVRTFYAIHREYHDEVELDYGHQAVMFFGRLLMIASRIAAFGAIAKVHWFWFLVFAAIHLVLVHGYMKWLPRDRSDTSVTAPYRIGEDDWESKIDARLIFTLSRLSYFFIDVDVLWKKYTEKILPYKAVLYLVFLMENVAMLWIWFLVEGSEQQVWMYATFGGVGIGGYFSACVLMIAFTGCSRKSVQDKN